MEGRADSRTVILELAPAAGCQVELVAGSHCLLHVSDQGVAGIPYSSEAQDSPDEISKSSLFARQVAKSVVRLLRHLRHQLRGVLSIDAVV